MEELTPMTTLSSIRHPIAYTWYLLRTESTLYQCNVYKVKCWPESDHLEGGYLDGLWSSCLKDWKMGKWIEMTISYVILLHYTAAAPYKHNTLANSQTIYRAGAYYGTITTTYTDSPTSCHANDRYIKSRWLLTLIALLSVCHSVAYFAGWELSVADDFMKEMRLSKRFLEDVWI